MTQDASQKHVTECQQAIRNALGTGKCMLMMCYELSSRIQPEANLDVPLNWSDILKGISSWCVDKELIKALEQQHIDDTVNQANQQMKAAYNFEIEDSPSEDSNQETNNPPRVQNYFKDAHERINKALKNPSLRKLCLSHVLRSHKARVSHAHRLIARLPFRGYITTNYDVFIENAYLLEQNSAIPTFYSSELREASRHRNTGKPFVLKLRGDIYDSDSIDLNDLDLEKHLEDSNYQAGLRGLASQSHLLCIGFQPDNPEIDCLRNLYDAKIFANGLDHWIVVPAGSEKYFKEIGGDQKIHILTYYPNEDLEDFLKLLAYPVSREQNNTEENKREEEKAYSGVLETTKDEENTRNRSVQPPSQHNTQDDQVTEYVLAHLSDKEQIHYEDFWLEIDSEGHSTSRTNYQGGSEEKDNIPINIPDNIRLTLKLIESDFTEEGLLEEGLLQELGKSLYQMIFPPNIDKHFNRIEASAREDHLKLRIQLAVEPDELASLPWEFMYRAERGYYLAVNPDTVLSHYLNLDFSSNIERLETPFHLLIIIANPTDQEPLDSVRWEEIINTALAIPSRQNLIKIQIVKHATFENIRDALYEQDPNIIQFVGHGIYRDGKGYLAMVDGETNKTWEVDDSTFKTILYGHYDNLRLVSLTTCESAKSESYRSFLGIAPQLIQQGVPIVVAMRYSIPVEVAKIFLENFYTPIAYRKPVDWAVQAARKALAVKKPKSRAFATPVLYMRAKDGNIF